MEQPIRECCLKNLGVNHAFKTILHPDEVVVSENAQFVVSCEQVNVHRTLEPAWDIGIYIRHRRVPLRNASLFWPLGLLPAANVPAHWYANLRELAQDSQDGRVDLADAIGTGIADCCPINLGADGTALTLGFKVRKKPFTADFEVGGEEYGKIRHLVRVR